jgi:hypothetical protein
MRPYAREVWLVYELFRGSINTAELGWSERQVGDYVTTRKATNPHLLTAVGISKSIGMLFAVSGADSVKLKSSERP